MCYVCFPGKAIVQFIPLCKWFYFVTKRVKTRSTQRETRPPWPRQIITPILLTVKMLRLGGERPPPLPPLPKKKKKKKKEFWIITCTTIWVCHHYYGDFFCSFTHLRIYRSPPKFNQFFIVLPRTPP